MKCCNRSIRQFFVVIATAALALLNPCTQAQPWAGPSGSSPNGVSTLQAAPLPNGTKIHIPLKLPTSRKTGLELYVDSRWSNGYGYRPFEITVNSTVPSTSDHLSTSQMHTRSAS